MRLFASMCPCPQVGFLLHWESLLSTHGDELGMLDDFIVAVRDINNLKFRVRRGGGGSGASDKLLCPHSCLWQRPTRTTPWSRGRATLWWWRCLCRRHSSVSCPRRCRVGRRSACVPCSSPRESTSSSPWQTREAPPFFSLSLPSSLSLPTLPLSPSSTAGLVTTLCKTRSTHAVCSS